VKHVHKSRNKAYVEGGFDILQKVIDLESLQIGRTRGEFELATKKLAKVQGRKSPFSLEELKGMGFWDIQECADAHARVSAWLNARPKQRQGIGLVSADELRAKSVVHKRPLPDSERWRFCTVKREATIRRGFVECQVEGYQLSFRFAVNGVEDGVFFDEGYKVLVAFDPAAAHEGCHVFNRESGVRNLYHKSFGELMIVAPQETDLYALDYTGSQEGLGIRKKAAQAARSEFREVANAGKKALKISQAHDGKGNGHTLTQNQDFRDSENAETKIPKVGKRKDGGCLMSDGGSKTAKKNRVGHISAEMEALMEEFANDA